MNIRNVVLIFLLSLTSFTGAMQEESSSDAVTPEKGFAWVRKELEKIYQQTVAARKKNPGLLGRLGDREEFYSGMSPFEINISHWYAGREECRKEGYDAFTSEGYIEATRIFTQPRETISCHYKCPEPMYFWRVQVEKIDSKLDNKWFFILELLCKRQKQYKDLLESVCCEAGASYAVRERSIEKKSLEFTALRTKFLENQSDANYQWVLARWILLNYFTEDLVEEKLARYENSKCYDQALKDVASLPIPKALLYSDNEFVGNRMTDSWYYSRLEHRETLIEVLNDLRVTLNSNIASSSK